MRVNPYRSSTELELELQALIVTDTFIRDFGTLLQIRQFAERILFKFMPSPGKFCMVVETFVRGDLKFETRYFVNQIQHGGVSGGGPLNLFPKRDPFRQPCKICPVRP